jgi:Fe-S cluster biogenesis protein NfuA
MHRGFRSGTVVTLTATPTAGSTFIGWGGACAGTGPCVVTMSGVRGVTATFSLVSRTLTVAKTGAGTGTVASSAPVSPTIDCGATCAAGFDHGTVVTLAATPAAGSIFAGWSGACTGTGQCQVTMDAPKTVTATFDLASYALTVSKSGAVGTVTSSPPGIDCGATCSAFYQSGTVVNLTATPAVGSSFTSWSGACSGAGACQVTMDAARSVTATFADENPPRLANISTRMQVLTGNDVLIGGFIIDGDAPSAWRSWRRVRRSRSTAITNALANPTLTSCANPTRR